MFKKNLFYKSFFKLVISITKRIESFFNFFRDLNLLKKNHPKYQKNKNKKIFIILATIFATIIIYFLLPGFYNKDKIRAQLENQILQKYNFKVILGNNIQYGLFPKPYFSSKNIKIEYDTKIIADTKNIKIFISSKNFFLFNKVKVQNLIFLETNFKVDQSNFNYFTNLLNNNKNDQNLNFVKSKFFYLDQNGDVIFLTEMKKLEYLYQDQAVNKVESKFEIFNLPVSLKTEHNVLENKIYNEVNLNSLRLNFENSLYYTEDEFKGNFNLNLINKNKLVNYSLKNDNLNLNTDDNKLIGEINIKPFFLLLNFNINEIEIKKFFKNDSMLVNLLKSEIFNNNNFSGKISVQADNLKDLKNVDAIKFDILFQEGTLVITNINFVFKNSVVCNINDLNVVVDNNKLKFIGDSKLKFININNFYSHFQVKKNHRIDIDEITSNFIYNFDDNFMEFNQLKVKKIKQQILDEFLINVNSDRKNVFNKIVLRNTVKEFFKIISLD